jgi:hypothetical protein
MLNSWNIDKAIIENAFIDNQLDKLIHETYNKHGKPDIIKCFVTKT